MTVIGYDTGENSMAGFTDGVDLAAGTTISVQVILNHHSIVFKLKLCWE
jgi:hypothetical protein